MNKGTVGITLTDVELEAVRTLFATVWSSTVTMRNWKEKETDNYCQWQIVLPDRTNRNFTVTDTSLEKAVDVALKIHRLGVDYDELR